jgi:ATP-dependent NAD(P)H-hydrate dehydratase
LCHIFCAEEAAIPIKSYSPELIVHPLLPTEQSIKKQKLCQHHEVKESEIVKNAVENIAHVFPRLDTLVIGPGLGRDRVIQEMTRQLIQRAKEAELALILDGDALYLISLEPELIKGYTSAILTPNAVSLLNKCD